MPKSFVSDVVIYDEEDPLSASAALTTAIKVNEPLHYKGYVIYQASFEDGGSLLQFNRYSLNRMSPLSPLSNLHMVAKVGEPLEIKQLSHSVFLPDGLRSSESASYQMDVLQFRPINVENNATLNASEDTSESTSEKVEKNTPIKSSLLGSAKLKDKEVTSIGPSVEYRLTGRTGESIDFKTYAYPVQIDGTFQFLFGVKALGDTDFRFLKIPADTEGTLGDFLRLNQALGKPAWRELALKRYIASQPIPPIQKAKLEELASRMLTPFIQVSASGALVDFSNWIEQTIPTEQRERTAQLFLELNRGQLFALLNIAREKAGLTPRESTPENMDFINMAMIALSDLSQYPLDELLSLNDFKEVKASVFQVSRAPGTPWVYLGCLLLLVGFWLMLYLKEEKRWFVLRSIDANKTERIEASHS
jgi:cytochrome c biogenesis protein